MHHTLSFIMPITDDERRVKCVVEMMQHVHDMDPKDLLTWGDAVLGRTCQPGDIRCHKERDVLINVIGQVAKGTFYHLIPFLVEIIAVPRVLCHIHT